MYSDLMPGGHHRRRHLRIPGDLPAEHEEGSGPAEPVQFVEHRGGALGVGSVVEGQRHPARSADAGQVGTNHQAQHPDPEQRRTRPAGHRYHGRRGGGATHGADFATLKLGLVVTLAVVLSLLAGHWSPETRSASPSGLPGLLPVAAVAGCTLDIALVGHAPGELSGELPVRRTSNLTCRVGNREY